MEMCYDGALVMPSSYAVMDEEEMMYVEGGMKASAKWWGIRITLNSTETNYVSMGLNTATYIYSTALGILNGVAGALAGAIALVRGNLITKYNNNNSGIYLDFNWAHIALLNTNGLVAVPGVAMSVGIKDRY